MSPLAFQIPIAVWLFALGGAIGSFLNVVVYRLPAGRSIVYPGSFCPKCMHPIRWYDNVPILGWILLGGRCRDCHQKISARYPLVETLLATIFLVLGWIEMLSGGANLPMRPVLVSGESVLQEWGIGQSASLLGWHLFLLGTLLAAALIEYDGHRPPWRLFAPGLIVGLLGPIVWPDLHPVPSGLGLGGPMVGLVDSLAGLIVGASVPLGGWYLIDRHRWFGLWIASALIGLFLGWQAALILTVFGVALSAAFGVLGRSWPGVAGVPPTAWLAFATLLGILCWQTR